jgi:hypothetical protein
MESQPFAWIPHNTEGWALVKVERKEADAIWVQNGANEVGCDRYALHHHQRSSTLLPK